MGQRSQVYIVHKKREVMVAHHLQWNWGEHMISRANQLLDYISKNVEGNYSNFKAKNFDIANRNGANGRDDLIVLASLIQMNLKIGSFVTSIDLVKEHIEWFPKYGKEHAEQDEIQAFENGRFKMNYKNQDNNDGALVIEVQEDEEGNGKVKYALMNGWWGTEPKIVNATDYMKEYWEGFSYYYDEQVKKLSEDPQANETKLKELQEEFEKEVAEVMKMIVFIDGFELLTEQELQEIFDKEYSIEECLGKKIEVSK